MNHHHQQQQQQPCASVPPSKGTPDTQKGRLSRCKVCGSKMIFRQVAANKVLVFCSSKQCLFPLDSEDFAQYILPLRKVKNRAASLSLSFSSSPSTSPSPTVQLQPQPHSQQQIHEQERREEQPSRFTNLLEQIQLKEKEEEERQKQTHTTNNEDDDFFNDILSSNNIYDQDEMNELFTSKPL